MSFIRSIGSYIALLILVALIIGSACSSRDGDGSFPSPSDDDDDGQTGYEELLQRCTEASVIECDKEDVADYSIVEGCTRAYIASCTSTTADKCSVDYATKTVVGRNYAKQRNRDDFADDSIVETARDNYRVEIKSLHNVTLVGGESRIFNIELDGFTAGTIHSVIVSADYDFVINTVTYENGGSPIVKASTLYEIPTQPYNELELEEGFDRLPYFYSFAGYSDLLTKSVTLPPSSETVIKNRFQDGVYNIEVTNYTSNENPIEITLVTRETITEAEKKIKLNFVTYNYSGFQVPHITNSESAKELAGYVSEIFRNAGDVVTIDVDNVTFNSFEDECLVEAVRSETDLLSSLLSLESQYIAKRIQDAGASDNFHEDGINILLFEKISDDILGISSSIPGMANRQGTTISSVMAQMTRNFEEGWIVGYAKIVPLADQCGDGYKYVGNGWDAHYCCPVGYDFSYRHDRSICYIFLDSEDAKKTADELFVSAVLAHELGHFMGLFHTIEFNWSYVPAVNDFVRCSLRGHDSNNDGIISFGECDVAGADDNALENLMFPAADPYSLVTKETLADSPTQNFNAQKLTDGQRSVLENFPAAY
ncbi:MAG: hypothetical protein ACN4E2_00375 [Nitrospinota bacterium]